MEPPSLRRGRTFHQELQKSWQQRHGGATVVVESGLAGTSAHGTRAHGRFDIRIHVDRSPNEEGVGPSFQAIVELKDRDFDTMLPRSLRQLIARDRRQLLSYVAAVVDLVTKEPASDGEAYVMASIAYSRSPRDQDVKSRIEAFFDEESVAVIWEDETIEESKVRLG